MSRVERRLDLRGLKNEDDFHDRVTVTFEFPHYYGRNRDAFWDCLTDIVKPMFVRVCGLESMDASVEWGGEYIEMIKVYSAQSEGRLFVVIE